MLPENPANIILSRHTCLITPGISGYQRRCALISALWPRRLAKLPENVVNIGLSRQSGLDTDCWRSQKPVQTEAQRSSLGQPLKVQEDQQFISRARTFGTAEIFGVKIPNCQNAQVPKSKVTDYLLSVVHPEGESKAKFFLRWGFNIDQWTALAAALIQQANEHDYSSATQGKFGTKYMVIAPICAPNGITPPVKTIWMFAEDDQRPRLVTAYPAS